jgi:hypothetical protein
MKFNIKKRYIYGSAILLVFVLFIYMKSINFNYRLIGRQIVNSNIASPIEKDGKYNSEYPWEFKTIIFNRIQLKELRSHKTIANVEKEPEKVYMNLNEPMFLSFAPYTDKKDGKFMLKPILMNEIKQLENLINNGEIVINYIVESFSFVEETAENLFLENETGAPIELLRLLVSLYNFRVCRVTYVLDKKYNIWVPCFVTYEEYVRISEYLNFMSNYSHKEIYDESTSDESTSDYFKFMSNYFNKDIYVHHRNINASNFYVNEIVEKETGLKHTINFFNSEDLEEGELDPYGDYVQNGEFEPTEMEKEKAREAFAKYKGKKTVWDENPDGGKFRTWVTQEGEPLLHLKVKNPKFPYLEN